MSPRADGILGLSCRSVGELLIAALACLLMVLALSATSAQAGTWTLLSCRQPDGQPAPTDGWSTSATGAVGPYSGDTNSCAEGGNLSAVESGEAPQGAYEGPEWVFTAPSGSTIAGGTIAATLTSPHGQAWLATPNATHDAADVIATCQYNLACGQDGTLTGAFPITHVGGSNLYAVAVCVGPYEGATTCPASGGLDAAVYVSSAAVELANNATPTAGGFGGTLLNPNVQGTQELTFQASDPGGPGIYLVVVQIDGKTVYSGTPNNNEGRCVPIGQSGDALMFDHSQPCRTSESVAVPVNTATLSNGAHTLKVTVEDAAQNASVVYDGQITTLQPANDSLGALPGGGAAGIAQVAQPNGVGASEGAHLELGQHRQLTRSFAKRALRVSGRLLSAQGQPISGATLDVLQQVGGSSTLALVGHAKTAANGTFLASVRGGPSRTIEVAYRAFSTDAGYAAVAKLTEQVEAGIQLYVSPRRTGSEGTITLIGRVLGPVPRQGVSVNLLVHYRGRWEPFRTPRTDAAGRFSVVYQFEGALGRFPFRAEVPSSQADFAFGRGLSKVVDVATN
ncbi:MAG: hypothetical protein WBV77_01265 [Solirubrobacteraceae bacterium]